MLRTKRGVPLLMSPEGHGIIAIIAATEINPFTADPVKALHFAILV